MLLCCFSCRKNEKKESKTEKRMKNLPKLNKERTILLSRCTVRDSKQSRFIKKGEAGGLLTNIIKIPIHWKLLIQWWIKTVVILMYYFQFSF